MGKYFLIGLGIGLFSIGMIGTARAAIMPNMAGDSIEDLVNGDVYSYYQNSGVLIGEVLNGNWNQSSSNLTTHLGVSVTLEAYVEGILGFDASFSLTASTTEIDFYGWDGSPTGDLTSLGSSIDGKVDDFDNYGEYTSGTWELNPSTDVMSFYSVKAGDYFAIYHVLPAAGVGSWSTYDTWGQRMEDGNQGKSIEIEISHFNGFNSSSPIPEPATMLLFGTGLIGLAGIRGRRFKK